jgi:hypothetical protein
LEELPSSMFITGQKYEGTNFLCNSGIHMQAKPSGLASELNMKKYDSK